MVRIIRVMLFKILTTLGILYHHNFFQFLAWEPNSILDESDLLMYSSQWNFFILDYLTYSTINDKGHTDEIRKGHLRKLSWIQNGNYY